MKKLALALLLVLSMNMYSQKVYNLDKKPADTVTYQNTGDVAIYKGQQHPVYLSQRGKLFILVTSRRGSVYRKYLKA